MTIVLAEDDISVKKNLGHFALLMWLSMGCMALIKTLLVSCPKHYDFFGENNTELFLFQSLKEKLNFVL